MCREMYSAYKNAFANNLHNFVLFFVSEIWFANMNSFCKQFSWKLALLIRMVFRVLCTNSFCFVMNDFANNLKINFKSSWEWFDKHFAQIHSVCNKVFTNIFYKYMCVRMFLQKICRKIHSAPKKKFANNLLNNLAILIRIVLQIK